MLGRDRFIWWYSTPLDCLLTKCKACRKVEACDTEDQAKTIELNHISCYT